MNAAVSGDGFCLVPGQLNLEVGDSQPIQASFTRSGRVSDVATQAVWQISDEQLLKIDAGRLTALAVGVGNLTAIYQDPISGGRISALATFTIQPKPVINPLDLMVVLDASGSFIKPHSNGLSFFDEMTQQLPELLNWFNSSDRMGLLTSAGVAVIKDGELLDTKSACTKRLGLTQKPAYIRQALQKLRPDYWETSGPDTQGRYLYPGATSLGFGLQEAYQEFLRYGRRSAISASVLLVTDGHENLWAPNLESEISRLLSLGVRVAVLLWMTSESEMTLSGGNIGNLFSYWSEMASPDLLFRVSSAEEFKEIYPEILTRMRRHTIGF